MRHGMLLAVVVVALSSRAHAFYLPGVAPRKYVLGEQLMVKVNTLTSSLTPLQFDYYNGVCVCLVYVACFCRFLFCVSLPLLPALTTIPPHPAHSAILRAQGRREGAAREHWRGARRRAHGNLRYTKIQGHYGTMLYFL